MGDSQLLRSPFSVLFVELSRPIVRRRRFREKTTGREFAWQLFLRSRSVFHPWTHNGTRPSNRKRRTESLTYCVIACTRTALFEHSCRYYSACFFLPSLFAASRLTHTTVRRYSFHANRKTQYAKARDLEGRGVISGA